MSGEGDLFATFLTQIAIITEHLKTNVSLHLKKFYIASLFFNSANIQIPPEIVSLPKPKHPWNGHWKRVCTNNHNCVPASQLVKCSA